MHPNKYVKQYINIYIIFLKITQKSNQIVKFTTNIIQYFSLHFAHLFFVVSVLYKLNETEALINKIAY